MYTTKSIHRSYVMLSCLIKWHYLMMMVYTLQMAPDTFIIEDFLNNKVTFIFSLYTYLFLVNHNKFFHHLIIFSILYKSNSEWGVYCKKASLKIFVVVIPKEGFAGRAPPILLLVWQWLNTVFFLITMLVHSQKQIWHIQKGDISSFPMVVSDWKSVNY